MDQQPTVQPATPTNPQTSVQPSPASPPTPACPWEQYLGHIVRWEDGTTWFVLRDGRHWIPDGKAYASLTATGTQVFNLSPSQLDSIPDVKGSHISLTGK